MNQGPELECKLEKPEYDDDPITITDLNLEDLAELAKLVNKPKVETKKKGIFDFDSDSDNAFNFGNDLGNDSDDDAILNTYSIKKLTNIIAENKKDTDLKLKAITEKLDSILELMKKESQFTEL